MNTGNHPKTSGKTRVHHPNPVEINGMNRNGRE
jgi:hypothetical protein